MRFLLLALLALSSGCATVTGITHDSGAAVKSGEVPFAALEISNTCWSLLTFLPVASGDPTCPNSWTCRWFTDTTTVANQMTMLEAEAKRLGARKAVDVSTVVTDESLLFVIFLREKIHTTATLVK